MKSNDEVNAILNATANDVLDWFGAEDTGTRDAVNLIVNVFVERLTDSAKSIEEVIEENYDATPDEVYDWCRS
ncbi:hypothetical protein ACFWPU_00990 [Streptomyces sp. NPDC058471]|uniref:hypothetical protein n=1 Tax=Streptomyces sp. NPDC058471 TaxID=3346516 RepID=UPI00364B309D